MNAQAKPVVDASVKAVAEELLEVIAEKHLCIVTLQTRGNDRLDMHEVSVWKLKVALLEALIAGMEIGVQLFKK